MISIIIPCYNGFRYMENCLRNLENQTNKDFEVIIVDDCSNDDTNTKLMEYNAQSDLNIKVIRNSENRGPGESRRIGVECSKGSLVAFCDCDDWYEVDFVEEIEGKFEENNFDLCMFNNYKVLNNKKIPVNVTNRMKNAANLKELLVDMPMSLCRCVIARELIKQIDFSNSYYGEDGVVLVQLLIRSKKSIFIDNVLYNYYMRNNSAHNRPNKRCFYDAINNYKTIERVCGIQYFDEAEYITIRTFVYEAIIGAFKAGIEKKEIKNGLDDYKKNHRAYNKNMYLTRLNTVKRFFVICAYYDLIIFCKIMSCIHDLIVK